MTKKWPHDFNQLKKLTMTPISLISLINKTTNNTGPIIATKMANSEDAILPPTLKWIHQVSILTLNKLTTNISSPIMIEAIKLIGAQPSLIILNNQSNW